jgi:TRAP-type C4-dicarboxylate transport system substrate-binding protein
MDKLEKEVKQDLTTKRGMVVVDNVDLAAFKKAGQKAYEVLKIADVKNKVFAEIGKK